MGYGILIPSSDLNSKGAFKGINLGADFIMGKRISMGMDVMFSVSKNSAADRHRRTEALYPQKRIYSAINFKSSYHFSKNIFQSFYTGLNLNTGFIEYK